jgi:hypothetical protein
MNKSEIANRINQPTEKIDAILKDAGLPVDVEHYSPEQIESLEAIAKMVETKQAKNFKDAGGLHRKIQNEAQLNEIALRHSLSDRIPEITSALKLKPESITDEQFEQFRIVCEQAQQGMDLGMVANAQLDKGKAAKAKPQSETGNASASTEDNIIASVVAASNESAIAPHKGSVPAKDRPLPGLAKQSSEMEFMPDGQSADLLEEFADGLVGDDALNLAQEPFLGVRNAADSVDASQMRDYGRQVYYRKLKAKMNSPEVVAALRQKFLGKK